MVRASTNEPSDDKKEAIKKSSATKKKPVVTGIWPCKMNGCTKQFAREADLKRHQRTTKLHSIPSFACPQCDATFTRTDALRRHQKSRHNGVVIEPSDQEAKTGADNDAGTSESYSKSRSGSPSSKGKERASASNAASAQSERTGPSSYYRQHTAMSTPYVPRPLVMDPQYAQVGLPTSATRLNVATNWTYHPHPWPEGTQPPIGYPIPGHMCYSPHYRSNGPTTQLSPDVGPHQLPTQNGSTMQPPTSSHSPPTDTRLPSNNSDPSGKDTLGGRIIDPSLSPSSSTTLTEQQVLAITEAAVKAVLEAEAGSSRAASRSGSVLTSLQSEGETAERVEEPEAQAVIDPRVADKTGNLPGYGAPLERPEPMEHMLTEDGEPMLNPAELLTQESLASPPPS